MNKEEIEKAKIGLWNIRTDCLKMICGISNKQDREEYLNEIDVIDDFLKYIKELERKESILNKVQKKIKATSNKYKKEYKNVEKIYFIDGNAAVLQELSVILEDLEEILNIIEGEKNESI